MFCRDGVVLMLTGFVEIPGVETQTQQFIFLLDDDKITRLRTQSVDYPLWK